MSNRQAARQADKGEVRAGILFRPIIANTLSHDPCLDQVVQFRYREADPYAVQILIPDGGYVWTWEVARDLLEAGRRKAVGEGVVRVRPEVFDGRLAVVLEFYCDDNSFHPFGISPAALDRFLRRSYEVVPRGAEPEHGKLGEALEQCLASGVV
jgi:hypothetical protein